MPPISPQKVIGMAYLLLQNYHESKPPYQKRKIREVAVAIFPFYGNKWRRHFIKNSNEASNFDVLYDTVGGSLL